MSSKFNEIKIFDLAEKKVVGASQILKESVPKDSLIYLRDGKAVRVSKKETLLKMMRVSDLCLPSIVVYAENDSITTIISGNYYNDKGMGVMTGAGFGSFLGFIISSAIKQMAEPPGISRYTYLTKPLDGWKNISLRQEIDDYEISLEAKQQFFGYKGYLDFHAGTLAIYHNKENKKLMMVLFRRNQTPDEVNME